MNKKQTALMKLTKIALVHITDKPVNEQIEILNAVTIVTENKCPQLSDLCLATSLSLQKTKDLQLELFQMTQG